jgi:DNA-binding beta-propeller fold protein YncE
VPRHAVALLVAVVAIAALSATALAAASAPVAAASAHTRGSGRQHTGVGRLRASGRPDRVLVDPNRGGPGSASSGPRRVFSDPALLFGLGASAGPFGFSPAAAGSALVGSAPVGKGPDFTAVDPATHTLYVTNGSNEDGDPHGGNTVSVIDTRHCQAADVSSCKGPWPTLTVGSDPNADPSGLAIDQQTDTLYVANGNNGGNNVAVFDGATCNAETSAGCGQTPAMVPVGMGPVVIFDDPANQTVYVVDGAGDDLSMLGTATCNATDLAGCPTTPPPTVTLPGEVTAGTVDLSTHTVYVTVCADAVFGCPAGSDGVSVFDASTCNATVQSGCGQLGLIPTAVAPYGAQVDAANQTLYAASAASYPTISAFDLRHCNAANLAGCASDTPGTVTPPGAGAGFGVAVWVAVDPANHTVYMTSQKDDAVIVVNANVCNGSDLAGCATLHPPEIHTGSDPEILTLDPDTQTLYTANQDDNDVSVIAATQCDAQTTSGCRQRVPEAPISGSVTVDPAVATLYVANGGNTVAMLNASRCNANSSAGCAAPRTVKVGTDAAAVAIDPATHTVYVANGGVGNSGTVSVFGDRKCNATDQAGCRSHRARTCPKSGRRSERQRSCRQIAVSTLHVPEGNPVDLAVNPSTDTIYVATITRGGGPNLISVFNGRTCNASTRRGCRQKPANVRTGEDNNGASTESVAVNSKTNTIYATSGDSTGSPSFGDSVYMIDGSTCDATHRTGCAKRPATISLGSKPPFGDANPFGITVDQATDTIYTANLWDGEGPGTVSVINGATCNAQTSSGCDQTPATAPAGFGTIGIALDPTTNQIYAINLEDTSVTTINGNTCNATNHTSCNDNQTSATVGDYPGSISLDPKVNTAYVSDNEGISLMPLTP